MRGGCVWSLGLVAVTVRIGSVRKMCTDFMGGNDISVLF